MRLISEVEVEMVSKYFFIVFLVKLCATNVEPLMWTISRLSSRDDLSVFSFYKFPSISVTYHGGEPLSLSDQLKRRILNE